MNKRKLDRYEGQYAARTKVMRSSAMRDLMSLTARPEVISLAGGLPATDSFPQEVFQEITEHMANSHLAFALQYGPTEGFDFLRKDIATVMAEEGTNLKPNSHVLITTGGQQAIDLVTKAFIDPGDVIVVEGPSYAGALTAFFTYQAQVIHVPLDNDGLNVDLLEGTLARLQAEGTRAKFFYLVPNFSNPAGVSLSLERRHRILRLAQEHDLLILEDNPYGLLRFEGEPLPTLFSLDSGDHVIYVGSFSKIISPGIRVGWVVAPAAIYQKLVFGKQATDLCPSTMSQLFVHGFIDSGLWRDYIASLRGVYRSRRDAMAEALAEYFPEGSTWTMPSGGFFIWATLPEGLHAGDLLVKAIEKNVAFVRGDAFYADGQGVSSMRLAYSAVPEDRIREGIRRLAAVVDDQRELYRALGLGGSS